MAEQGSWYSLLSVLKEARQDGSDAAGAIPAACPNDGEPLRTGPDGQLYCPFDGWRRNR